MTYCVSQLAEYHLCVFFNAYRAWRGALLAFAVLLYAVAAHAEGGKTIHFKIVAGHLKEGPAVVRVSEGETVSLIWSSDQATQVHLHGYNLLVDVGPGGAVEMKVLAKATGRFPVSLHDAKGHGHGHKPLTYLEVYPK